MIVKIATGINSGLRAPSFVGLGLRIRKPNPTWYSPQSKDVHRKKPDEAGLQPKEKANITTK